MLVAEPVFGRRYYSVSGLGYYGGYSAGGILAYEPTNLADYGFIKVNIGKFFKRTVVGGVKKVVRTIKKKPWLIAAAAGVGALAYAAHAGYLAPVIAKAKMAKWAISAKLAPVTARVGAFVKHRIVKPVSSLFAAKAVERALSKPVKKPHSMKPISAGVTATAGAVTVKKKPSILGGILRGIAKAVTPTLAQTANVLLQASLAKKGLYHPFPSAGLTAPDIPYGAKPATPVRQEVYTIQPVSPARPAVPAPEVAPSATAPTARAGFMQMFKKIPLPLLLIGGLGIVALLLLTRGGGGPAYMPAPMPYYPPPAPAYPSPAR